MVAAADYAWLQDDEWSDWREAYCVTTIADASTVEVIDALDATPAGVAAGLRGLVDPSFDRWGTPFGNLVQVVGLRDFSWGTLMVEVNGYVGVTEEVMRPLLTGRDIVSHFQNVNAVNDFRWWRDGVSLLRLDAQNGDVYDPPAPEVRAGVIECGIPIDDENAGYHRDRFEREFALAERLSGVRVTPESLRGELVLADVRFPD